MALIITLVFALAATGAARFKCKRLAIALSGAAAAWFLACSVGLVARPILKELQDGTPDTVATWKSSAVLVVLGVGTAPTPRGAEVSVFGFGRLNRAAELYRECSLAGSDCKVLISGGVGAAGGAPEAPTYAAHLQRLGVPAARVIQEAESRNTWENARNTCALLKQRPDQIVLVTSGIHLKRSLRYFEHFCGPIQGVRADWLDASTGEWSLNLLLTDVALHEIVGELRFQAYEALGLNR